MYAARLWWMLRWLGHEAVAVLDGGFAKWAAEGRPVTTDVPRRRDRAISRIRRVTPTVNASGVHGEPRIGNTLLLIDARAPERFRGEVEPIDPGRRPHSRRAQPAVHAEPRAPTARSSTRRSCAPNSPRCSTARRTRPSSISAAPASPPATTCSRWKSPGCRGTRLYPGSWSEWCADPARPVDARASLARLRGVTLARRQLPGREVAVHGPVRAAIPNRSGAARPRARRSARMRARGSGCTQRRASVTCGPKRPRLEREARFARARRASAACSLSSAGGNTDGAIHATPDARQAPSESKLERRIRTCGSAVADRSAAPAMRDLSTSPRNASVRCDVSPATRRARAQRRATSRAERRQGLRGRRRRATARRTRGRRGGLPRLPGYGGRRMRGCHAVSDRLRRR